MTEIEQYRIIKRNSDLQLATEVNYLMQNKWAPLGGAIRTSGRWCQTMVYVGTEDLMNKFKEISNT